MKRFLSVLMLSVSVALVPHGAPAQVSPAPAAAPTAGDGDKPVKISELVKKVKKDSEDALKRIAEIDKIVNPVMEQEAVRIFGIKAEEFRFLRMQAESKSTDFFNRQRRLDRTNIEGVVAYFDEAYSSISSGQFWFGREESLVPEDSALFEKMKQDVLAAVAKRPEGSKILDMLTERDTLKSKLNENLPLYKYLSERREWWRFYPEYMTQVKSDFEGQSKNPGGLSGATGLSAP